MVFRRRVSDGSPAHLMNVAGVVKRDSNYFSGFIDLTGVEGMKFTTTRTRAIVRFPGRLSDFRHNPTRPQGSDSYARSPATYEGPHRGCPGGCF